eukprot:gene11122-20001_t
MLYTLRASRRIAAHLAFKSGFWMIFEIVLVHPHYLVESRDMLNIKKEFGLNEMQCHDNDQRSVFAWIKEWETSDSNPVMFYKLQGEECRDKLLSLSKNDFIVILQTEEQKHLARHCKCMPTKKLLCTWHVDKARQEAIHQKIRNFRKQASVYTMMKTVLDETEEASFQDRLSTVFTGFASSQGTHSFYEYFNSYWASKTSKWAYCYRLREGINTNKYRYLRGKSSRRLDNCLFHLLKYSQDKCF